VIKALRILGLVIVLVASTTATARTVYAPPMPADLDQTDFYLITVGLGDELYTRFGHTIVRVVDRQAEADYNFNWGTFDFDEPGFAVKFFRGILMYRMAMASYQQTIAMYRDWENRRVWQEKLNLTGDQKKKLMTRIIWNAQPENVRYPYQYFYNNCATKVRDYIDEAIGGQIALAFKAAPATPRTVYRDYVRRNLGGNPFVGVSLDVLMNADIDKVMTKWDEMFLPAKLREHLLTLPRFADNGEPVTGAMLLGSPDVLVDLPDKDIDQREARGGFIGLMAILLLLFLPVFFRQFQHASSANSIRLPMKNAAFRFVGGGLLVWGMISGAYGTAMVVTWAFSAHTDLHHNANLFIFWPLDWVYALAGAAFLRRGTAGDYSRPFWRFLRLISQAHVAGAVIFALLHVTGSFAQNVSYVFYYLVPLILMVSAVFVVPKLYLGSEK